MRIPLVLLALLLAGCMGADPLEGASEAEEAASAEAEAPTGPMDAEGSAGLSVIGACAAGACAGALSSSPGELKLPVDAAAWTLEVTWEADTPTEEQLIVDLLVDRKSVASAQGASPLTLEGASLAAGKYDVWLWSEGPSAMIEVEAAWRFHGAIAPATE